jgi:hypothetical protein
MIAKCISCHHEIQCVTNVEPCDWCGHPMKSIGSDYVSDCDDTITDHKRPMSIPEDDSELPLDFMLDGVDSSLRIK